MNSSSTNVGSGRVGLELRRRYPALHRGSGGGILRNGTPSIKVGRASSEATNLSVGRPFCPVAAAAAAAAAAVDDVTESKTPSGPAPERNRRETSPPSNTEPIRNAKHPKR